MARGTANNPCCCPAATLWLLQRITTIALVACSVSGAKWTHGNENDRLALLEFKANIIDPLGVLSSWNSSHRICEWFGVTCGQRHRRVTRLELNSQGLSGTMSPHIGNLSFLRVLHLENNSFHSRIPLEVGRLSRLGYFSLYNNSLHGPIPPSLSSCSNLVSIILFNNKLQGQLPVDLGFLSKLKRLSLGLNELNGVIPASIGNLTSLVYLFMQENKPGGRIPYTLSNLRNLKELALWGNNFVGNFPSSITNISSMEYLDLSNNQLVGTLPLDLGITLPILQDLDISQNQFFGPIPKSISNMSQLSRFVIQYNNFTGDVPSFQQMSNLSWLSMAVNYLGTEQANDLNFLCSLANSTTLQWLDISENNFGGTIPKCIGNMSNTLHVSSSHANALSGPFPSSLWDLIDLEVLSISSNSFSGIIPPEIGSLNKIKALFLGICEFTGEIPHSLGNLTVMTTLSLRGNNLTGTIPSSLGKCQSLLLLDIAENKLAGAIPPEIMSLSSLSIYADFSENNLSGELPLEIGNLKNLGDLRLNGNKLSGEIPSSLGSCMSLMFLYMQDNMFTGPIPSTLSSLKGIEGKLPKEGVFANTSATSVLGNKELCGGLPEYRLPKCESTGKSTNGRVRTASICTVSGILATTLVLLLLYFLWHRKQRKTVASSASKDGFLKVSYRDLLKATDGFSSANLIGTGSFGSVFRGVLGLEQTAIAVKVLNLDRHGASKSFIAECEALRNIRHRNLVKVLTACSGSDYLGNDFKALVYEFMVNGSLDEWLHPPVRTSGEREDIPRQLEYGAGAEVSINGDVYSYGILVLEMFTGKRPTDNMFGDGLNLHSFAKAALPEQVLQIIDPVLLGESQNKDDSRGIRRSQRSHERLLKIQECLVSIVEIGVVCSSEVLRDRMSMGDVAAALQAVRNKLLGS
ncbi:hypothetical protein CRG98_010356 [Punica granatum]|uniref:Protein kinase domain-containing protein n=1 Tax=Punica granatum TaxID=22663 RepID=A0A2I0KL93_PUNGR|nr:hypothetical protein CRG98_010356 [Punica granatum]